MIRARRVASFALAFALIVAVGAAIYLGCQPYLIPVAGHGADATIGSSERVASVESPRLATSAEAHAHIPTNATAVATAPSDNASQAQPAPVPMPNAAPRLDRDQALDFLAQQFAKDESRKTLSEETQRRLAFEQEPLNEPATRQVNDALAAMVSDLDIDAASHLSIVSFECRADTCLMLAAANGLTDVRIAENATRPQAPADLQVLAGDLTRTPWWEKSGPALDTFTATFHPEGNYLLYQVYFEYPQR